MNQQILSIFTCAVKSVLPRQLIKDNLHLINHTLIVANQLKIQLNKNLHVIGFGKASLPMASAVEEYLYYHINGGVLSIPIGTQNNFKMQNQVECLLRSDTKIEIFEGATNNLPDDKSVEATERIISYLQGLTTNDIILVLISGGGSALLPSPIPPVTLDDKLKTIQLLTSRGATIQQLNIVRKQLSSVKGGGLARFASSTRIISLILSDIIGDPLGLIASGPTVFDTNSPSDALRVLKTFDLEKYVPESVIQLLNSENIKPSFPLANVTNFIIGNNNVCLKAAKLVAESYGYATIILSNEFDGEAKNCGEFLSLLAYSICNHLQIGDSDWIQRICTHELFKKIKLEKIDELKNVINIAKIEKLAICILTGGETTVIIKNENGIGGRNQELVLSASVYLDKYFMKYLADYFHVVILSAGTDGIDGPTSAAGAITDIFQKVNAKLENLDVDKYLNENDSNNFYKAYNNGNNLVMTGHTGTNVMDVQIVLISPVIK